MKAPELTEDLKRDYDILRMRSVVDPTRFYKSNDRKTIPKHFQVTHVIVFLLTFYLDIANFWKASEI